jgi:hypothetical protein
MNEKKIHQNQEGKSEIVHFSTMAEFKDFLKKERYNYLTAVYHSGSPEPKQPQLFKMDKKADRESKKFYKLIKEESKKRKIDPYELLKYFAGHKKELINLYEKSPEAFKPTSKKFKKVYTHKEIENIMHSVLKTRKLKDIGISNIFDDSITGEVKIWEGKGVEYIVKVEDLLKLDDKNPKVYVTQTKSLLLLMGMIQEQQFNNDIKEPKCEFTLSYYAARRGYTKEEIKRGGNFFNELKRDLFSGAYTTYRTKKIEKGKKYTFYNTFYGLGEPEDPGDNWKIEFNNPYGKWILEILNGEAGQYFIKDHKAIEDRETTDKPFLFFFYQQLIKRKRANLLTTPVKIGNLLEDMKLPDKILASPKRCFELLRECLIYFSEHYEPDPEIESIKLYNDYHKTKTIQLPISISEAFKNYEYEDFKDLIKSMELKDIREAYISFKRPYNKPRAKHDLDKKSIELRDNILEWARQWESLRNYTIDKTEEERRKFIEDRISFLGYEEVDYLFEEEKNKEKPHAFNFLIHVLSGTENYEDTDWDNY